MVMSLFHNPSLWRFYHHHPEDLSLFYSARMCYLVKMLDGQTQEISKNKSVCNPLTLSPIVHIFSLLPSRLA